MSEHCRYLVIHPSYTKKSIWGITLPLHAKGMKTRDIIATYQRNT